MALASIKHKSIEFARLKLWRVLLFEFIVVLAGVLAAQFLANWFADRNERARAADVRKQLVESMHEARELGEMRTLMAVCLLDRLNDIYEYGKRDAPKTHPVSFIPPPAIALGSIGLDAESRQMIRKYYGIDDLMAFQQVETAIADANSLIEKEDEAWITLSLLAKRKKNPSYEVPVEVQIAINEARRVQQRIYGHFQILISRTIMLGAPSHGGTIKTKAVEPGSCSGMLNYSLDDHAKAYAKDQLPDGTPIGKKWRDFAHQFGASFSILKDLGWLYARRKEDTPDNIYGTAPKDWKPMTDARLETMKKEAEQKNREVSSAKNRSTDH